MTNPCYDKPTRTDCPNRKAGCGASCPKWAAYVEERDRRYKENYRKRQSSPLNYALSAKALKREIRSRKTPRYHEV